MASNCRRIGIAILFIIITLNLSHVIFKNNKSRNYEIFVSLKTHFFSAPDLASVNLLKSLYFQHNLKQCKGTLRIVRNSSEFNAIAIQTACEHFKDRVEEFSIAINSIRNETLKSRESDQWSGPKPGSKLRVISGTPDDYFYQLSKYPYITTVVLPWLGIDNESKKWSSLDDVSNLYLQKYYQYAAEDELCDWIEAPGVVKMAYVRHDIESNWTCNRNVNETILPRSLDTMYFHARPLRKGFYWPNNGVMLPQYVFEKPTPFVFYLHIITNAMVTDLGDVKGQSIMLAPYTCSFHKPIDNIVPNNVNNLTLYNEIYVISQYYGVEIFHRMSEVIPRIAVALSFLKLNPTIKILVPRKDEFFEYILHTLGLTKDRLIVGHARAKIVYIPRASFCWTPNVQESQIVSDLYRKHIENVLGPQQRNRLILIKRSAVRRFVHHTGIVRTLKNLTEEYGLQFEIYSDNPSPNVTTTMSLFHSAIMIVAPHGAGLGNMYFSQPGTYIIEGVCNLPTTLLCNRRQAAILGHHWHGIPSSPQAGCPDSINVAAADIERIARTYLEHYRNMESE